MANWFKSLFSRGTEINNQTIVGDVQQADTINNINEVDVDSLTRQFLADKQHAVNAKEDEIKFLRETITALAKGQVNATASAINNALAAFAKGDATQAEKLFEQTAQEGEQTLAKTATDTALAYRHLGILAWWDDTEKALKAYQRATALDPDNADGWNQLGQLFVRVGELDQAIIAFQTVLKLGQSHQDQEKIAWAYGNLGIVYKTRGELDKAVEMHNKALAIDYANLGLVYDTRGELDKAVEMHNKALAIDEQMGNKQGMAEDYGNLGNVYQTRGELDKAVEMYNKGLEIQIALGDKQGMAAKYGNLGLVYYKRGELDKAVEMHNKALEINQALGKKEGTALNYGNLGLVYYKRGELDKAVEFYNKALAIDEQMGNKEGIAIDYANLGLVYALKGNIAEAKRYWQKSIELYKTIGSPEWKDVQKWLDDLK
jgi:tetratricopeptide (TPR) repeat protein